jgi:aspartate racemase
MTEHVGLIGGLGVGAAVLYYQGITAACAARGVVPRLTMAHANAPTALALVTAGNIVGLADYLAGFAKELTAAGATFLAIPAITPHICRAELRERVSLPILDILDTTAATLRARGLKRVALFGTRFTIEGDLFGALGDFEVVRPRDAEIAEIHSIYLELAQQGRTSPANVDRIRQLANAICARDGVEAIIIAGTDFNLVLDEANAGFPAVDSAAAHIAAIVERMGGPKS